jgi:hypothetical protein
MHLPGLSLLHCTDFRPGLVAFSATILFSVLPKYFNKKLTETISTNSVLAAQETPNFSITSSSLSVVFSVAVILHFQGHLERPDALFMQNAQHLNAKACGIYSYHCALNG